MRETQPSSSLLSWLSFAFHLKIWGNYLLATCKYMHLGSVGKEELNFFFVHLRLLIKGAFFYPIPYESSFFRVGLCISSQNSYRRPSFRYWSSDKNTLIVLRNLESFWCPPWPLPPRLSNLPMKSLKLRSVRTPNNTLYLMFIFLSAAKCDVQKWRRFKDKADRFQSDKEVWPSTRNQDFVWNCWVRGWVASVLGCFKPCPSSVLTLPCLF